MSIDYVLGCPKLSERDDRDREEENADQDQAVEAHLIGAESRHQAPQDLSQPQEDGIEAHHRAPVLGMRLGHVREEMDRIGCQEMEMPVVQPADLWRESGRYQKIGPELVRFKDRTGRDMVLAMTHEEVVATLLRDLVSSYRQLPLLVYHIQTKFRDEPRSRGGLIRVREFVMKDSYSCDIDTAGLDRSYQLHYEAYQRIFERLGLDAIPVGADVGMMGGSLAHEFMVLNEHEIGRAHV